MDRYPFIDRRRKKEPPLLKEYAFDLSTLQFKRRNGRTYQVIKNEALEIKVWKTLMTEQARYPIFPYIYGHTLEKLIGCGQHKSYIQSQVERYIKECLESALSDYINSIEAFTIEIEGAQLTVKFSIMSVYGELVMEVKPWK